MERAIVVTRQRRAGWAKEFLPVMACGLALLGQAELRAQMVQLTTPVNNVTSSFFERFGVGFGASGSGPRGSWFFNNGGVNSALPPFGNYDPAADARFGFGIRRGNGRLNFSFAAGQGSSSSIVGQAPSVVVPNGGGGLIGAGQLRPFVTGFVPVVGGQAGGFPGIPPQPPALRLGARPASRDTATATDEGERAATGSRAVAATTSSAARGAPSVSAIRAAQAAEDAALRAELQTLIDKGLAAEQGGQLGLALIYYQQAVRRATGDLRERLAQRIGALKSPAPSQTPQAGSER